MAMRFIFSILILLPLGCSDNGQIPTYPVSGKVVFADGTPLPGGGLICLSDSDEASLSARGIINPDGTFTLGTYGEDDGAIAGRHLVAIDPPIPENFNPDAGPPPRVIHPRFQHHDTSGLEFTVSAEDPNEITLEVSRK